MINQDLYLSGLFVKGIILFMTVLSVILTVFLVKKEFVYLNIFFDERYEDLTLSCGEPLFSFSVPAKFSYNFASGLAIKFDFYHEDVIIYRHNPIYDKYGSQEVTPKYKVASLKNFKITFEKSYLNTYNMTLERNGKFLFITLSSKEYDKIFEFINLRDTHVATKFGG